MKAFITPHFSSKIIFTSHENFSKIQEKSKPYSIDNNDSWWWVDAPDQFLLKESSVTKGISCCSGIVINNGENNATGHLLPDIKFKDEIEAEPSKIKNSVSTLNKKVKDKLSSLVIGGYQYLPDANSLKFSKFIINYLSSLKLKPSFFLNNEKITGFSLMYLNNNKANKPYKDAYVIAPIEDEDFGNNPNKNTFLNWVSKFQHWFVAPQDDIYFSKSDNKIEKLPKSDYKKFMKPLSD